jgi:phosphatidylglycerophosphate synthase
MANILSQSWSFMTDSNPVKRSEAYLDRLLLFFFMFMWVQTATFSARTAAFAFALSLAMTVMLFCMDWKGREFIKRHEIAHVVFMLVLLAIVVAIALYGIQKRGHNDINQPGTQIQSPAS